MIEVMDYKTLPLHSCQVQKKSLIINRFHTLLHFIAILFLLYYRVSFISQSIRISNTTPILPHVLLFASELTLFSLWLLNQANRWRPVSRQVFPERLPENKELPAIDVFICTSDPIKEPTVGVMNTVISAMALDYPPEKLNVYLSDDGGSPVTLKGIMEAWRFAKWWLPFCRRFGIKTICPEAYFSEANHDDDNYVDRNDFVAEKNIVKGKYEDFLESVMRIKENEVAILNRDRSSVIEVIQDKSFEQIGMPLLVYISREQKSAHPHHFKAGALNVLLRVSSMISNSPYILGLDCDMYCNDPNSARQAMCFFLDPEISSSLSHVQFPQKFHNISKTDIYDSQLRSCFKVAWPGTDGLKGPPISGSCYYLKREALYGTSTQDAYMELKEFKHIFGTSNEFIKSLRRNYNPTLTDDHRNLTSALLEEAKLVASYAYEIDTKWGKEVGFRYFSVVEDVFTSFHLHYKGWSSVYFDPPRAAFLGAGTTNLNDVLVQGTRWSAGLVEVAISRFNPLIYALRMPTLVAMYYAELDTLPFCCFPLWCYATIPQLYLLNAIPLYPKVSSPFFVVFSFIFLSSQFKHIQEIFFTGGSFHSWRNEQRMWMIKSVTCHLYGSLNAIIQKMGMQEASFLPTNKVADDEQFKRYQMGIFDFQASTMLLTPLCTLVILNLVSLVGGVEKTILARSCNEMFVQIFLACFVVLLSYPIIEGMILRKDKGRISNSVTRLSIVFAIIFLAFGKILVKSNVDYIMH